MKKNIELMGIDKMLLSIEKIIRFWEDQNIAITPKASKEIQYINEFKRLRLPADFALLYERANGMEQLYPNYTDAEGFLFYPVEAIISAYDELGSDALLSQRKIYIFSDYLIKCWLYGYEILDDGSYVIGIVAYDDKFNPITDSLADFIDLYIEDSPILYEHKQFE